MLYDRCAHAGTLQHLDAEPAGPCPPSKDSSPASGPARTRRFTRMCWILALSELLLLSASVSANAQASHSGNGNTSAAKTTRTLHRTNRADHPRQTEASSLHTVPAPSAMPPRPVPPADQPASPATIAYRQGVLSIHAYNSSLITILDQVSRQTGLVLEGLGPDKRMYGQYGPGSLTSTLTALLSGSGYNYILVGGDGGNSPGKLILTQNNGSGAVNVSAISGNGSVAPTDAASSPLTTNPSGPVRAKTPQEIFDELRKMHPQ